MKTNNLNAQKVLAKVIPELDKNPFTFNKENTYAVLTKPEHMSAEQKQVLEVLIK